MEKERLSKIMARRGLCSRREADTYIEKGYVFVDGIRIDTLGTKVSPDAKITLSEELKEIKKEKVTILLYKPLGYVSCVPENGYEAAVSLITRDRQDPRDHFKKLQKFHFDKLAVAGRLDINSKGLLVLTQDGAVAKSLINKDCNTEKEYFVRVDKPYDSSHIEQLEYGLELDGQPLKRARVIPKSDTTFMLILTEGKKRQIRRMCELVDLKTLELKRVRIGRIHLGDLKVGEWRFLRSDESFV
ncbi:MAG: Dual-specificity RNA pseudouridine synthase RluF [Chlamydiia bacterium]|nr:Dual-specificity RNA pseudouridine synthase RluF [Chlamydiia bacterium]